MLPIAAMAGRLQYACEKAYAEALSNISEFKRIVAKRCDESHRTDAQMNPEPWNNLKSARVWRMSRGDEDTFIYHPFPSFAWDFMSVRPI
jgi:hypothetical protein